MKEAVVKFAVDVATGAVAGACVVLAATNLETVSAKALALALFAGAINGAVNAARRYAAVKVS